MFVYPDIYFARYRRFARIFSVLSHPVLLPFAGLVLFLAYSPSAIRTPDSIARLLYSVTLLSSIILPLLIFQLMYMNGLLSSFEMPSGRERATALAVVTLINLTVYVFLDRSLFQYAVVSDSIEKYYIALGIIPALTGGLSWFWKISLHACGWGGLVAVTLFLGLTPWFLLAILTTGLTGFARLLLGAHKPSQVYAGFALGFVVMFATLLF